jgi:hypothetical protein
MLRERPIKTPLEWERDKLQYDYAWRWFAFHADQRTKMFNYMLLVFGILAAAVANILDKVPAVALILCALAAIMAVIFALLDKRNRNLTWLGEDILYELECRYLFEPEQRVQSHNTAKDVRFGIFVRRSEEEAPRNPLARGWRDARAGAHRFWLPAIAIIIGTAFLAIAGDILWSARTRVPPPFKSAQTTCVCRAPATKV